MTESGSEWNEAHKTAPLFFSSPLRGLFMHWKTSTLLDFSILYCMLLLSCTCVCVCVFCSFHVLLVCFPSTFMVIRINVHIIISSCCCDAAGSAHDAHHSSDWFLHKGSWVISDCVSVSVWLWKVSFSVVWIEIHVPVPFVVYMVSGLRHKEPLQNSVSVKWCFSRSLLRSPRLFICWKCTVKKKMWQIIKI